MDMVLSPSLGNAGRRGSHFVSGGGQKVAVVSRHTRACPLVPPTCPLFGFSPLSVSPKRDGRRRVPLYRAAILLLQSRTRQTPPPRICDFPTSGNSTTFPLIPAAPSGHVVGAEMLSPDLLSPLPCASRLRHGHYHRRLLLRLSSTSNGDDPTRLTTSRDIITPFYSRFIGLYQLHCHRTVCIVAACLPGCRHRNRVAVPRLRSAPDSLSPRDALRHALVNQRRWFIVVVRLKIAELSGYCSRFSAVSERRQCNVKIPILQ